MSDKNIKVFISYSHIDSDYENKVLSFANKLRSEGIDANIDLYEESPSMGWQRWMEIQIKESDYVLVIASKSYYDKCYSTNKGKGISWEVNIVYQQLYDDNCENKKFIPVFFDEEDIQYILTPIKPYTYYNIGTTEGYEKLYWRLRGVTTISKPPLGKLRPLPEKERKMFFTTPINLDKWNKAGWNGMLYLFYPGRFPVLGLLYKDYSMAKNIFLDWRKSSKNLYGDEFLKVDYIVPPFPKGNWVYKDKERNYGKGYFVHIGPNIKKSIDRAIETDLQPEELLVATVSRYQWMDEINGSQNRDMFEKYIKCGSEYMLIPVGIRNKNLPFTEDNLIIDFNYAIKMKTVHFQSGIDIDENDICKAVLNKPN